MGVTCSCGWWGGASAGFWPECGGRGPKCRGLRSGREVRWAVVGVRRPPTLDLGPQWEVRGDGQPSWLLVNGRLPLRTGRSFVEAGRQGTTHPGHSQEIEERELCTVSGPLAITG